MHNAKEVAKITGLSLYTVNKYFRNGIIKGVKIGKIWHVTKEDLEKYLKVGN